MMLVIFTRPVACMRIMATPPIVPATVNKSERIENSHAVSGTRPNHNFNIKVISHINGMVNNVCRMKLRRITSLINSDIPLILPSAYLLISCGLAATVMLVEKRETLTCTELAMPSAAFIAGPKNMLISRATPSPLAMIDTFLKTSQKEKDKTDFNILLSHVK